MRHDRQPTRKQLSVAVIVSLLMHSSVIGGWYASRSEAIDVDVGPKVLVETPSDGDIVVTICDEPRRTTTPVEVASPKMLPSEVVRDVGATKPPEAPPSHSGQPTPGIQQTGHSGTAGGAGGHSLHGKMKAGKSIVYVLDRSSSMSEHDAFVRAKACVLASLRQLDETVQFQIVAYNSGSRTFGRDLCPATAANIERAEVWLNDLLPEGRSEHRIGVREGLYFKSDALFLLTDADDLTATEVKAIEGDLRRPVVVHAVLFRSAVQANSPLDRFVQQHRGMVRYVGNQP